MSGGTGLRLAIAKQIVGGRVDSEQVRDVPNGVTRAPRSAYWVRLYEHAACQAPRAPFSFFLSSYPPFFCLTAPQAFSRPDRVLSQAGARRCCQGWPLFSGHPLRASAFTAIEHDGRLDGSGSIKTPVRYLPVSLRVNARYPDHGCFFWQVLLRSPWRVR
jgi:hypothetical protein